MSAIKTIKDGKSNYTPNQNIMPIVFEITAKMITANDIVEMGNTSVDEIAPPIRDAHYALSKYPNLPSAYTGLV